MVAQRNNTIIRDRRSNDNIDYGLEEEQTADGLSETDTDTFDTDDTEARKLTLIQQYARGKSTNIINEATMKSLTRAVRLVIIPKVKFLPGGKGFGSFEQPDFTHPNCWVNKVFNRIANLKNASDKKKADVWMTYCTKIKEQFSLHRAGVTMKIKAAFCNGMFII